MKNLQEKIEEIRSAFDYEVKVEIEEELYPSIYYWINITIKKQFVNTFDLRKLNEITKDYWITITAIRKDTLKITLTITKESN